MPERETDQHEETIRKVDYDRYLAAMFSPASSRSPLFALYAFNYEVAKVAETVHEPIAGHIRLQWWHDAIAEAYAGQVRAHPVVVALARLIKAHRLPQALFEALIEARDSDLEKTPFADMASLDAYADATSGHLMRLAARILGAGESLDEAARGAGIAYALTGLLRALPYHASQRRLMFPSSALEEAAITTDEFFSGTAVDRMPQLIGRIAKHAKENLAAARCWVPRALLPALLPASLVPAYLRLMEQPGFDPYRHTTELPVHRRQLAMGGAFLRARV